MNSADYKDRFKAEYFQTKIRCNNLHKMLVKKAAGTLDFEPAAALAVAPITAIGMNYITGGHYYQGQSATYGSRRASRELKQKK